MIQFDNVQLKFADKILFEIDSLSINSGEKCALIGRNGSGKTSLLKLLVNSLTPDYGKISIPNHYHLGYLNQHIVFSKATVLEEACLGLKEEERDLTYQAETILLGLGFTLEDFHKSPSKFSGGYHLRLHLAKLLASDPDCLLLDEPTNYLDIIALKWLKNFLKNWRKELIIISHERSFIDEICSHTIGIHRGKVKKYTGATSQYFTQIAIEEEVYEKTRQKMEKKNLDALDFIKRFGAKATKAKQAQSKLKMIAKQPALEKLSQIYNLQFSFPEKLFSGQKMIDAKKVSFSFTHEPLITDFSLEIHKENKIAIIGENGKGKSTLLRLLTGDLSPKNGSIFISQNVQIGYFGQTNIQRLDPEKTIEEEILSACDQITIQQARGIAGLMMFSGDDAKKPIKILSGGEKSRVLLGKIIAIQTNLLMLDEPTHHLDMESIEALVLALENYDGGFVIVTHSEDLLHQLDLTHIIYCESGKQKIFLGNFAEFLEKVGFEKKSEPTVSKIKKPIEKRQNPDKNIKQLEKKIEEKEKKIQELEMQQYLLLEKASHGKFDEKIHLEILKLQKQLELEHLELNKLFESL